MHYVAHISHQMQKHNLGMTCPCVLLIGSESGPPELEKYCVDVSRPEGTRTHYITHKSH
jgi:hypothetical protein